MVKKYVAGLTVFRAQDARKTGAFLETGSLHPPLAALRRFPCASEKTPLSPQTCAPSARALPRAAIPLKKAALPLFLKLIAMV